MPFPLVYFRKRTPFLAIVVPLMAGIILQWYGRFPLTACWLSAGMAFVLILSFFILSFFSRYRLFWLNGIFISLLFMSVGALLVWYNDIRHDSKWFGNSGTGNALVVSLDEPLVEKTKSWKAEASVNYILDGEYKKQAKGKIILYFKKNQFAPQADSLTYGTQIIFNKPLQEIKNTGNPGGFDYKRYLLFRRITHQVYLTPGEFEVLSEKRATLFQRFFYPAREKVLGVLRNNIKGAREAGLAEALLIGYKNDLDKTLVQSYTNTGVVHVIAISGLHIGLIYWLLLQLCRPLKKRKCSRWLQPVLIICGLWAFSLLAGGQPSVLRSAVMFTCIVLGQSLGKNSSVYNTLALSAFILLCYNPYWLWDVGFQLSYAAVLSIVIFMKPVYNWLYIKNKALDFAWKLNAVTLAAQVLTLPVSVFHFHQFPGFFLLTNIVAVPLSSLILVGEVLLCAITVIPAAALFTGKILSWLIMLMNDYIERIERLPFSLWDGLQVNILQAVLLVVCIAGAGCWLMQKAKHGLITALTSLFFFFLLRSWSFIQAGTQQKIIVYNVPRHRAMDFINGRDCLFAGDTELLQNEFVRNFHLKPSRTIHRTAPGKRLKGLFMTGNYAGFEGRRILLVDETLSYKTQQEKQVIDLLVVSGNPKLYISRLSNAFDIKQVVFDGSASPWKLVYWKKDCDSLKIPYHDVSEKGAFVMNLN